MVKRFHSKADSRFLGGGGAVGAGLYGKGDTKKPVVAEKPFLVWSFPDLINLFI